MGWCEARKGSRQAGQAPDAAGSPTSSPAHLHERPRPKADVGAAQARPGRLLAVQQAPVGTQDGVGARRLVVGPHRVQALAAVAAQPPAAPQVVGQRCQAAVVAGGRLVPHQH